MNTAHSATNIASARPGQTWKQLALRGLALAILGFTPLVFIGGVYATFASHLGSSDPFEITTAIARFMAGTLALDGASLFLGVYAAAALIMSFLASRARRRHAATMLDGFGQPVATGAGAVTGVPGSSGLAAVQFFSVPLLTALAGALIFVVLHSGSLLAVWFGGVFETMRQDAVSAAFLAEQMPLAILSWIVTSIMLAVSVRHVTFAALAGDVERARIRAATSTVTRAGDATSAQPAAFI